MNTILDISIMLVGSLIISIICHGHPLIALLGGFLFGFLYGLANHFIEGGRKD